MKKIKVMYFDRLTNEEHYQFMFAFRTMVDKYDATKALLAVELAEFDRLLELECTAINTPLGSPITAKIKAADKALDKLLILTITAIDTAKYSLNPALVRAAEELQFVLKPYGRIQGKKYKAEIGAVKSLLEDLKGKYLPQSTTVGIVQWLDSIQEVVATEEALFMQRGAENARRTHRKKMKDIRPEVETLLRRMTKRVEVAATDTTQQYDTFIAELNEVVRDTNERHRQRQRDIAEAIVDSLPEQTLDKTGYATPLCNVSIKDPATGNMLELVFAKDYTIFYRRNNKIGNAELVVRGKGRYRGVKMVTFRVV
jgi:ElaB/YqjD/DUF883 family membrane-anchored ribosome-binding protein